MKERQRMREEPLDKNGYHWVLRKDIMVLFDCCLKMSCLSNVNSTTLRQMLYVHCVLKFRFSVTGQRKLFVFLII